ncbi:MAG: beta-ketoacyl-ACP synthase III [Endomicrobiia bacterium]
MNKKFGVEIIGTGSYLPEKILTNFDLEKIVETSNEWITTRTGIKERRIADKNTATSDLAINAAIKAIEDSKIKPEEIDLIIVATVTPDMFFPSTACIVQKKLGIKKSACFDIFAACSGFIYGLGCAKALLESGEFSTCLLIGAETLSKFTNWKDRSTCVLFGDGAGAMILRKTEKENNILSIYMDSDGSYGDILTIPGGGSRNPATIETVQQNLHTIHMNGKEVFKLAVIKMIEATYKAIEMAGKKIEDISLIIPHQANKRIIDAMKERLNVPSEKIFVNLQKYGNMSSATTIVALDEARTQKIVKKDDLIELVAFGGGLTWGASVIKL